MVNGVDVSVGTYGVVQRVGKSNNGRVVYQIFDSSGEPAGRISLPQNQVDTFERTYNQIIDSAREINEYVNTHSSPVDIKNRKRNSVISILGCGIVGGAIPIFLTRNSTVLKQILATAIGVFAGLITGLAMALEINTPKGSYKFSKAKHKLLDLDIRVVKDTSENSLIKNK